MGGDSSSGLVVRLGSEAKENREESMRVSGRYRWILYFANVLRRG